MRNHVLLSLGLLVATTAHADLGEIPARPAGPVFCWAESMPAATSPTSMPVTTATAVSMIWAPPAAKAV